MNYQITPTIESTDEKPKFYVLVLDNDTHAQAGEFHNLPDGTFKVWDKYRNVTTTRDRDSAIRYIVARWIKPTKKKSLKRIKSQTNLFV